MNNVRIRPFRPEDQAAAQRLIVTGLAEHFGFLDPTANPDLDDISSTYADATFLLAWQGNELVGTGALIHEEDGVARIVRMSVAPHLRRRGIGTLILERLCEQARTAGYHQIVLETTATWDDVIAFYRRNEFRTIGSWGGDAHFVLDLDSPPTIGRTENGVTKRIKDGIVIPSTSSTIPRAFGRTMVELHGEAGMEWLNRLPALVADCAQRWSLTVLSPFEPLSYNFVAPAVRADGTDVVLKIGVPDRELLTEIAALRLCDGHGMIRLLDADPDQGILLLERLQPGTPLFDLKDDEQATAIAAQVMQQLWQPVPQDHPFPTVADWARGMKRLRAHFHGGTGPFPSALVEAAETLFPELIASMDQSVVLHGDLHHWNILRAERQPWLALDPKGVLGEPAYEVGALLRNPMPHVSTWPQLGQILARRVDQLVEILGFDRERLISWGLTQAVLSAWWSIEDHGHGGESTIAVAKALADLQRE